MVLKEQTSAKFCEVRWNKSSFPENKGGKARREKKEGARKETTEGGGKEEAARGREAQEKGGREAKEIV